MMASDSNATQVKKLPKNDHLIYKSNPLEQKSLINNVVEVTRSDGQKIIGTVFTVDPVSESIVLVTNTSGTVSMDIIMGHAVSSVEKLLDAEPAPLEAIFPSSNPAASLAQDEVVARHTQLKAWLLKNRLPVKEDGDVLKLEKALTIFPPYGAEQCISDNEIILGKVQELILSMPKDL